MGKLTGIEWTDSTWSPFAGCSPVSPGCKNCYAARLAVRLQANGVVGFEGVARSTDDGPKWTGKVHSRDNLLDPIRWTKKARKIFVNSQSDTFHENAHDEKIDEIFGVMLACHVLDNVPGHTFQVLTKRSDRMRSYLSADPADLLRRWARAVDYRIHVGDGDVLLSEMIEGHCSAKWRPDGVADMSQPFGVMRHPDNLFPLPNVWLGVSVETEDYLSRVVDLLDTPAAKRFVSAEPLLEEVSLRHVLDPRRARLDWVIAGGESLAGSGKARPVHPSWIRRLRDECAEHHVPFFFKQWGEWCPVEQAPVVPLVDQPAERPMKRLLESGEWTRCLGDEAECMELLGKKGAGAFLDGRLHQEWPA